MIELSWVIFNGKKNVEKGGCKKKDKEDEGKVQRWHGEVGIIYWW